MTLRYKHTTLQGVITLTSSLSFLTGIWMTYSCHLWCNLKMPWGWMPICTLFWFCSKFITVCQHMPLVVSLVFTTCHYLSIPVTICQCLSLSVSACHYLSTPVTISHYLSLSAAVCHYLPLYVTVCHYLSLSVNACHCLSLYVNARCCLSLCFEICSVSLQQFTFTYL